MQVLFSNPLARYLCGGSGRFGHQILVDTGSSDGDFRTIGGQRASTGKASWESSTGVLLRHFLNDQHLRHSLLSTRGVLCNRSCKKKSSEQTNKCNYLNSMQVEHADSIYKSNITPYSCWSPDSTRLTCWLSSCLWVQGGLKFTWKQKAWMQSSQFIKRHVKNDITKPL